MLMRTQIVERRDERQEQKMDTRSLVVDEQPLQELRFSQSSRAACPPAVVYIPMHRPLRQEMTIRKNAKGGGKPPQT